MLYVRVSVHNFEKDQLLSILNIYSSHILSSNFYYLAVRYIFGHRLHIITISIVGMTLFDLNSNALF